MSDQQTATPEAVHFSHGDSRQINSLHGLRFFAAGSILFSHACNWIGRSVTPNPFDYFGEAYGIFGMSLFFVLSGFVIQYNYSKLFSSMRFRWAFLDFAGARFARLFPLYIVFQSIGVLLDEMIYWIRTPIKLSLLVFFAHALTLTQSWFYIIINNAHIINNAFGLSWSISTEIFFYLIFPFIVMHVTRVRSAKIALAVLIGFSVLALFGFVEAYLWREYITVWAGSVMPQKLLGGSSSFELYLFYISPWARIFEFVLGVLTANFFMTIAHRPPGPLERRIGAWLLGGALASIVFISFATVTHAFSSPLVSIIVYLGERTFGSAIPMAVLMFCVTRYGSVVARFLSSRPLVMLGEMSYSIYAVHYFVLRPFIIGRGDPLPLDALTATVTGLTIVAGIAITLVVSFSTYRVIEVPARRWLRGLTASALQRLWGERSANARAPGGAQARLGQLAFSGVGIGLILATCWFYQFVVIRLMVAGGVISP